MTTGTMNVLQARLRSILAEQPKIKWERLVLFKRDLEGLIENEALNAEYQTLLMIRVIEEMGHMVACGEVA